MNAIVDQGRRDFLGVAMLAVAGAGRWPVAGEPSAVKTPVPPAALPRVNAIFGPLKRINAGLLNVQYADEGPTNGTPVVLLHGWPYDIHTYVDVVPKLTAAGFRVIVPYLRGFGGTRFLAADAMRNGQQAVTAVDTIALMDALDVKSAILGGVDWGARTVNIVSALWPERCKATVSVSGYLIGSREANRKPLPPKAELQWWYQYYFATDRGRDGYRSNCNEFNRLIWQLASPRWKFDDANFARTAAAFANPDHVDIVVHNYRWRLGLAEGESKYDEIESRLAQAPVITVPTITLEGDANEAPHADSSAYAARFSGRHEHRVVTGGIGHNLPQEAPEAFARAIIDASRFV